MSSVPLVFIDTETTSLRRPWMPAGRRIWEVGAIRRNPNGAEVEYHVFTNESDLEIENADPFGLRIGRYFERHPEYDDTAGSRVSFSATVANTIAGLTAGAHLVGAVPSFDEESLAHLLHGHGYLPRWHYHLIDVENLAAGTLGLEPPYVSDDLFKALGVETPEDERHTALGDARAAMRLYDAVMAKRTKS